MAGPADSSGSSGSAPQASERFPVLLAQRRVLPVAVVFALSGVVFSHAWWARAICLGLAVATTAVALVQRRRRATVIIDADGYAVEERGREKLRVAWSEVRRVRAVPAEQALYVDCGDRARNLLVPPPHGYAFAFQGGDRLYQRIIAAVPDRLELSARLEPAPEPESQKPPDDRAHR